jgi:hypothetical protein
LRIVDGDVDVPRGPLLDNLSNVGARAIVVSARSR